MVYTLARAIFIIFFRLLYPFRVYGKENIPASPFIVCSNHISWLDPPLVTCTFKRKEQVYFMAKEELFQIPVLSYLISKTGSFPVKKDSADRKAVQKALELLSKDKVIGVFPEGTRNRTGGLQKFFDGASWIALKSQAPVVPFVIKGPYRIFRPIKVFIGPPIYFKGRENGKKYNREDLKEVSTQINQAMNYLLEDTVI